MTKDLRPVTEQLDPVVRVAVAELLHVIDGHVIAGIGNQVQGATAALTSNLQLTGDSFGGSQNVVDATGKTTVRDL